MPPAFRIRLHLVVASSSITINVTLFQMTSGRKLGRHIVTSGPYSDAICGVVTPQTTLQPGTYLIVPSTFTPGMEAAFKMTVYSSGSGVTVSPSSIVTWLEVIRFRHIVRLHAYRCFDGVILYLVSHGKSFQMTQNDSYSVLQVIALHRPIFWPDAPTCIVQYILDFYLLN